MQISVMMSFQVLHEEIEFTMPDITEELNNLSYRLQMKGKFYIKMMIREVAAAFPETIKVTDKNLNKSLTRH